jgi:hypothetical protein
MRALIEAAGFRGRAWNDTTTGAPRPRSAAAPVPTIQRLVKGDALDAILSAGQRNLDEGRMVSVDGIFDRE